MSHPEQESVRDLAGAYALGALGPDEVREFERLLAGSAELQRDVAEYREVAALLGLGESGSGPAPDLRARRARHLEGLERGRNLTVAEKAPAGRLGRVGRGDCGGDCVRCGIFSLRRDLRERDVALAQRDSTLAVQQEQLAERQALLETVLDPGVRVYQLTASGDPEPGIQLFWNQRRNQALINAYRLKPVPPGRAYQLWFIRDGKPVPR